jgi:hypothetical protein
MMFYRQRSKADLNYNLLPDIPPNPTGGCLYKKQKVREDPLHTLPPICEIVSQQT